MREKESCRKEERLWEEERRIKLISNGKEEVKEISETEEGESIKIQREGEVICIIW